MYLNDLLLYHCGESGVLHLERLAGISVVTFDLGINGNEQRFSQIMLFLSINANRWERRLQKKTLSARPILFFKNTNQKVRKFEISFNVHGRSQMDSSQ